MQAVYAAWAQTRHGAPVKQESSGDVGPAVTVAVKAEAEANNQRVKSEPTRP